MTVPTGNPEWASSRAVHVTVVMPVYNASVGVLGALERLAGLSYPQLDVLVVDDGSTDETAALVERHCRGDRRFRLVRLPQNGGVAAARNHAVALARGDYVWFVDWDDAWDDSILTVLVERAVAYDADISICSALHVRAVSGPGRTLDRTDTVRVMSGHACQDLMLRGHVHGYLWSKLIRRALLRPSPFPELRSLSDFAGVIDLVARARTVVLTPEVLYWHIIRPGSLTNESASPRLENLEYGHARMVESARARRPEPADERLVAFFTCWCLWVGGLHTALRLGGDPETYQRHLSVARAGLTARIILLCWSFDRTVGAKVTLIRLLGPRYGTAYRAAVSMRGAPRRRVGGSPHE